MGSSYISSLLLPNKASATWDQRKDDDADLTPIQFLDKYWGKYIEADVLPQADLRRFDLSLVGAIEGYCKARGLDPKDYLPPPARTRGDRSKGKKGAKVSLLDETRPVMKRGRAVIIHPSEIR
jgi:hypothetical protein